MMKNSRDVEDRVSEAMHHEHIEALHNENMSETSNANDGPLPAGTTILAGQYRVLELLHQRPRVNLYLGRRLPRANMAKQRLEAQESLVAIRELVLVGLPQQLQKQVEQAAFEEFVSPAMFGSLRLPGAGDRVRVEGERHYLVMQLRGTHGGKNGKDGGSREEGRPTVAITLAELLLNRRQWPFWLDIETALGWGVQLCRIVARLHRLGVILGDLNPNTIVVDAGGPAEWPPVLLVSWPPAPQFWPVSSTRSDLAPWSQIFPIDATHSSSVFAAPETFAWKCDTCSDVYSLGAILYLLLTRYAPAAQYRQHSNHIELIPPHLFNAQIPAALEQVVLCALSLEPAQRYATVFAFIEALEQIDIKDLHQKARGL